MDTHTSFLLHISFSSLPKRNHGPEKGPQDSPAEHSHRINPDHPTDEGVLAAPQESHDVRAHVIRVLLPEILGKEGGKRKINNICMILQVGFSRLSLGQHNY